MIRRFLDWLHWQLIRRCKHPSEEVTYDLLEGERDLPVKWCRLCGSVKAHPLQPWRNPRPDWRGDT